jgi:heme exporter protein A
LGYLTISDQPSLRAIDVSCRRGEEWLFRDLSFSVQPGQLVWLRGQNGSGKTSLLRIVAGLSRPDAGSVSLAAGRSGVYIGHANALKDDLTVTESPDFFWRACTAVESAPEAIRSALRTLAIHHRRHAVVRTLSQGQRRRVALARLALERAPSLWILDEPYDALDTQGIEAVKRPSGGAPGAPGQRAADLAPAAQSGRARGARAGPAVRNAFMSAAPGRPKPARTAARQGEGTP